MVWVCCRRAGLPPLRPFALSDGGSSRCASRGESDTEAEAGAGQSPTRLDHVRMGGVGASIAAERRKLSALKKEVKGQRWVATEVSRCRPAAITLTFSLLCYARLSALPG